MRGDIIHTLTFPQFSVTIISGVIMTALFIAELQFFLGVSVSTCLYDYSYLRKLVE